MPCGESPADGAGRDGARQQVDQLFEGSGSAAHGVGVLFPLRAWRAWSSAGECRRAVTLFLRVGPLVVQRLSFCRPLDVRHQGQHFAEYPWAVPRASRVARRVSPRAADSPNELLSVHAATCCGLGRSRRFHGSFARAYAAIVFGLTLLPHMWTC